MPKTRDEMKPAIIEWVPQSKLNNNPWDKTDDPLWLLTVEEFNQCRPGTDLGCINGSVYTIGEDDIDLDIRFGLIAFGFYESQLPKMPNA